VTGFAIAALRGLELNDTLKLGVAWEQLTCFQDNPEGLTKISWQKLLIMW
jgi:hypothetical protein